jgi:hypothetical protein
MSASDSIRWYFSERGRSCGISGEHKRHASSGAYRWKRYAEMGFHNKHGVSLTLPPTALVPVASDPVQKALEALNDKIDQLSVRMDTEMKHLKTGMDAMNTRVDNIVSRCFLVEGLCTHARGLFVHSNVVKPSTGKHTKRPSRTRTFFDTCCQGSAEHCLDHIREPSQPHDTKPFKWRLD